MRVCLRSMASWSSSAWRTWSLWSVTLWWLWWDVLESVPVSLSWSDDAPRPYRSCEARICSAPLDPALSPTCALQPSMHGSKIGLAVSQRRIRIYFHDYFCNKKKSGMCVVCIIWFHCFVLFLCVCVHRFLIVNLGLFSLTFRGVRQSLLSNGKWKNLDLHLCSSDETGFNCIIDCVTKKQIHLLKPNVILNAWFCAENHLF